MKLKEFKKAVSIKLPVERMIFFGSRATGNAGKWSDVDLIIVSKKFKQVKPLERGHELYDYWKLDYPVDFLCYSPDEFEKAKKRIGLASEALKNGITI
ncbi:nucleotidyltransferase domain-containing protein [Candidatus Micrarchaeota archaeon]|nr:nucleotidyltransferase domain-containing protein [Candidatus Micrarchaeota archaeon]